MRERKIGVKRYAFHPKITKSVPDYAAKQKAFEELLKRKKAELKAEVPRPEPFHLHESTEHTAEKVHKDISDDNGVSGGRLD
jgi:hypothetical protein